MSQKDLTSFYDQSYSDALDWWRKPARRFQLEISEEEAAYLVLENVALLIRRREYGRQPRVGDIIPADLAQMAQDEKVRLVAAACKYAQEFSLPAHFNRILQTNLLEPEEIEEIEHVLCQVDGLDAAVSVAAELVRPLLENNPELLAQLAQTRCVVATLVQQLSGRPDIVSVASRLVLVQRNPCYLEDGRAADWFTRFREWDREMPFAELLPNQPQASTLLGKWHRQLTAKTEQYGIAADAGSIAGIDTVEWLEARHQVRDDPNVRVRLGRRLLNGNDLELVVTLIGDSAAKTLYRSVEVGLGRGELRREPFTLYVATVSFTQQGLDDLVSLFLIDADGVRRSVDVEGLSDSE